MARDRRLSLSPPRVPSTFFIAALSAAAVLAPSGSPRAQGASGFTFKPAFLSAAQNKFTWPVCMEEVPGAPGSFLVVEKNSGGNGRTGKVWWVRPGSGVEWIKTEFLSVAVGSANASNEELGLLGLAFHPRFRENRKYYLDYNPTDGRSHVVEEREFNEAFTADAGKAATLLSLPANSGHNGGSLAFGPDGFLYVSTGDMADNANGQSRAVLQGKILRLDIDHPSDGKAYGIPSDNPFREAGQRGEIYAMGLRNPWRISFDPQNGDLWAGDVGAADFEELDRIGKGGNYGWPAWEGPQAGTGACATATCLPPSTVYGRAQGRCVIGGQVYRGDPLSRFYGTYFFGDYQYNGPVFALAANGASGSHVQIGELGTSISALGRDSQNNIYLIGHDNGIIYRLDHAELRPGPTPASIKRDYRLVPDIQGKGDGSLLFHFLASPGRVYRLDGRSWVPSKSL